MANRSDDSGRPAPGGTVADDTAAPARSADVFAKTEMPVSQPPVATNTELPTIEHGSYAIHGELARGGIGRILRARHRYLDRTVAIKEGLRGDDPAQARFIREALVTARLQHPGIIPVYEAGRWPDGQPFYAMKLVSGRALSSVIEETKTLEERLALLPNVIAVADAIAYAHSERIIHRDLKPDNVLVGAFGETVVIDWGLAKDLSAKGEEDEQVFASPYKIATQGLTLVGAIMGTPEYMSPEQAQGNRADERSDVYSIGCITYHVLVGQPPFRGASVEEIITKVVAHTLTPLEAMPGIPPDLASVVRKAMARRPEERYPTAAGLAEDLRRFQTGQLVSSKRYTAWQLVTRWARRHRTVLAVIAAALVLLAVIGALSVKNIVRERAVAQAARASAEARTNKLILVQARSALDHDPAEALAWLKTYPLAGVSWTDVHEIAIQAQALGPARHILEHKNARVVAFSPDGTQLVSAGRDKEVRIWNVATGALVRSVHSPVDVEEVVVANKYVALTDFKDVYLADGPTAVRVVSQGALITAIAFSRDGRSLASAGRDGTIHIVDTATRKDRVLRGHTGNVTGIAFSATGDLLASSGEDKTVRIWRLASGQADVLRGHEDAATAVAISADGMRVASAGRDKTIRITPLAGGAAQVLRGDGVASHIELDGERLVALDDAHLTIWDLQSGKQLRVLPVEQQVELTADHRVAVLGAQDGRVRVIDLVTADQYELRGQHSLVELAISPDGRHVAAIGVDFIMRIWEPPHGLAHTLRGHGDMLHNLAFSPDGKLLATASVDNAIGLWDVHSGDGTMLRGHQGAIFDVAFSPDGTQLASTSTDGAARLWSVATHESRELRGHREPAWHPSFAPDGQTLYTSGHDGTVRAWNVQRGEARVIEDLAPGMSLDVSPNGALVAGGGPDGKVWVWDAKTLHGRVLGTLGGDVGDVKFLPDGRHVVSRAGIRATSDLTVRMWDIETGMNRILLTAAGPLRALAISRDGKRIAAGGQDLVIRVVDLESGAIRELRGHAETVKALRFSPDGRFLLSGSFDRSVRLWSLDTGASQVLHHFQGPVWDVAFSPDGKLVAASSTDKTAWVGAFDGARCLPADPDVLLASIHDITSAAIQPDDRALTR